MEWNNCQKESFVVIGKEGSTKDGAGFIQRLWADTDAHFAEVAPLAKKDDKGKPVGIWGAMSDFSHAFHPWENGFTQGCYLAGVECMDDAEAPQGWTKWVIPGYEYLYAESEGLETFSQGIEMLRQRGLSLAGAAHDFSCPETGKDYVFLPIRKL